MEKSHQFTHGSLKQMGKKNHKSDETSPSSSFASSRKRHAIDTHDEPPTKISIPSMNFSTSRPLTTNVNDCPDSYSFFESFRQSVKPLSLTKHEYPSKDAKLLSKIQSLYQSFSHRFPHKPIHFNQNMLFNIMSNATLGPGSHVLIFEESDGFITAAAMLALQGEGKLCLISKNLTSQRFPALQAMDFCNEINVLSPIRLSTITKEIPLDASSNLETATNKYVDDESMDFEEHTSTAAHHRLEWVHNKFNFPSPFHSIIIASSSLSPVNILQQFYGYLCPSGTIAICTNIEEEAQMVHAFLIAHKATDIAVSSMPVVAHFSQNSQFTNFVISARKAK